MRGIKEILTAAQAAAQPTDAMSLVKSIFFGDPIIIPESMLPAIVVHPGTSNVTSRGTQMDQEDATIIIKLVQNLKDTLGASEIDSQNVKMTEIALDIFEERDSNDTIKPVTIIGALRKQPEIPYQGKSTCQWNGAFNTAYSFTDSRGYVAFETNMSILAKTISDRNPV